jgi:short-subunit dehydrogenase
MELKDKVALVTGASRGIGESIALKLLEKGAKVYGTSRSSSNLHPFELLQLDVTDDASCAQVVEKIIEKEGRLDIFVSNAGAGIGGPVEDSDIEEAKWQFETNFFGMLRMLYHVLPMMRSQRSGRIVLVSSVAGFLSVPYQGLYSSTKYAMEAIGLSLRNELRGYNVELMLVNPGDTKTGFTENRIHSKKTNGDSEYFKSYSRSMKKMEAAEINGMNPAVISWGLVKNLEKKRLKVRYIPGYYKAVFILSRLLPEKLVLWLVYKLYL